MEVWKNLDIQSLNEEIWKVIIDFPDYSVNNFGRVKSFKLYHGTNERILKQNKNRYGYLYINLCINNKYKHKQVHILVYETFSNYKLKLNECVHHDRDKNKKNNNFDNLIVISKKEHRKLHTTGKNNPNFGKHCSTETIIKINKNKRNLKLIEEKVTQIKLLLKKGVLTHQEIADMFEVSRPLISMIKSRKIWSYVKI